MQQSSLGVRIPNRNPSYNHNKIGRVTSTKDYKAYGKIEVVFLDYSQPVPIWVSGDIDREPSEGDKIIVGFLDNRIDAPYMQGYVRNEAYTSNFVTIEKDLIRIQLPIVDKNEDIKSKLLHNHNKNNRAYIELTPSEVLIHHPTGVLKFNGAEVVTV